jgi:hypothetical protein
MRKLIRGSILIASLALAVAWAPAQAPATPASDAALAARRAEELRKFGPSIVVKQFLAQMRKRFEGDASPLRQYIDPRYLEQHNLKNGPLPMQTVVTGGIHNGNVTDDPMTHVSVVETEEASREVFVFRTTIHEGNAYILPLNAPDPATGSFTPWILRFKL